MMQFLSRHKVFAYPLIVALAAALLGFGGLATHPGILREVAEAFSGNR